MVGDQLSAGVEAAVRGQRGEVEMVNVTRSDGGNHNAMRASGNGSDDSPSAS